jgi:Na+-transporting NADH:ubiquinone oxidoreductase subunit NqrE
MLKLETWVSLGSLGMTVMFSALMISFYLFLVGPDAKGPGIYVDPLGVLIQIISISGVPGLILAGTVFGLQKAYVVKEATLILVASGIVLILGMAIVVTIVPEINRNYIFGGLNAVPFVFMVGGAAVACFAIYSLYRSRKSQLKLEDERR